MKSFSQCIFRFFFSVIVLSVVTLTASAQQRTKLITKVEQLSTNADGSSELATLIDDNVATYWESSEASVGAKHYIQVDLGENFTLNSDIEDLVIYLQRRSDTDVAQPTSFNVLVSTDNSTWVSFSNTVIMPEGVDNTTSNNEDTHVYFLYRGRGTKEYSTRITTTKTFRYIRFEVEANNSRTYVNKSKEFRRMSMAEFQIYKLGRNESYSDLLLDRVRLKSDYRDDYKDFGFEYTQGVLDKRNREVGNNSSVNDYYGDWNKWNVTTGKWEETDEKFQKILTDNKIEMPDMSFLTSSEDKDLAADQKRQRTHVTEHILYAMPGDAIALYPFYDLATSAEYLVNFSHWYDYKTGGRLKDSGGNDLLDFLIDPSEVYRTDNHGYIAGKGVIAPNGEWFEINTVDQFKEFANRVNNGETVLSARVTADLDFSGVDVPHIGKDWNNAYNGIFDGGGHTFSNLRIENDDEHLGLFYIVKGGKICNFIIDNPTITSTRTSGGSVGAVVGFFNGEDGSGEDLYLEGIVIRRGSVSGPNDVGGILGGGNNVQHVVHINACAVENTSVNGSNVGALVGWAGQDKRNSVMNSWAIGSYLNFVRGTFDQTNNKSNLMSDSDKQDLINSSYWVEQDGGLIPKNNWIEIRTPEQFNDFAQRVNGGESTLNARVVADLDFSGVTVTPVENYNGEFDGCGHTLSNITITSSEKQDLGLFASVKGGRICNLILNNVHIESTVNNNAGSVGAVVGYFDGNESRKLSLENILLYGGSVIGNHDVGGILGAAQGAQSTVQINACAVVNTQIQGKYVGALVGWAAGLETNNSVKNSWAINSSGSYADFVRGNFSQADKDGINKENLTDSDKQALIGSGYWNKELRPVFENTNSLVPKKSAPLQKYGAVATFFYPRNPYVKGGVHRKLPIKDGKDEYVIAADFSQTFAYKRNVDFVNKKFIEPVINFRHIFRIRDGRQFAEEFSGSVDNNSKYIRKNLRIVSARAGEDFQIRLDSPVPTTNSVRSKWYYKISDTDYRRVCSSQIEVCDDKGTKIEGDMFRFSEQFSGQGTRTVDGIDYNLCGGGGAYNRMLICPKDKATQGRYTVRIIGCDYTGNPINIYGATNGEKLIVQEFQITFLPEELALMVEADRMDDSKYNYATEAYLQQNCGTPRAVVDFDQYRLLNDPNHKDNAYTFYRPGNTGDGAKYRFIWPVKWDESNYAFTYDVNADYNVYRLATHSVCTAFKGAAEEYTGNDNNFGKGKGLYDRLFYNTKGQDAGYFYYVNAASDPGVMARLRIDQLCVGSTLHVSAYVAEFSNHNETANIAFNFVAVLTDGQRVPLHTFTSGYVKKEAPDQRGQWMKIYYSFVPNLSDANFTSDKIDHYELELDNNCKSSDGADYAIDDIRVYVARPTVYAQQLVPLCDKNATSTDVRVDIPFDVLLQTLGLAEAKTEGEGQNRDLYYTFLDKEKYDEVKAKENDGTKAFNEAQLRYSYNGGGNDQTYGKLTFNTYLGKNDEYSSDGKNKVMRLLMDGVNYLAFNTTPTDDKLHPGKEYIISIYAPIADETGDPNAGDFNVEDNCAKTCVFRVRASGVIKIDGVVVPDQDAITCCENQQPVVQIDLQGTNKENGKMEVIDPNARFDWYTGSYDEFVNEKMADNLYLQDVLAKFREEYPNADNAMVEPKGVFTKEMRDYLLKVTNLRKDESGKNVLPAKVLLYASSYVFPPVVIPEGSTETYVQVLAIPIEPKKAGFVICTEPTEVRLLVTRHAPYLAHGFNIIYPDYLTDVPLRIGLNQLETVSKEGLYMPVRSVISTADQFQAMGIGEDKGVYLAETNDPAYKDLGVTDQGLMLVGEVKELVANKNNAFGTNIIQVVFDPQKIEFKESYYYRFAFNYDEKLEGTIDEDDLPCAGRHVFTLKIVPEYAKWIGKSTATSSLNWNNDRNWMRVTSDDLYLTDEKDKVEKAAFVTDGKKDGIVVNGRKLSYAPLDFTKTIIPGDDVENYPYMYVAAATQDVTSYAGITETYKWPVNPEDAGKNSPAGKPENSLELEGGVTYDVQYDMAAYAPKETGIYCRPWYMNACEQIHFKPRARIYNQQHLVYEKAWVDMEMEPSKWYTLSSPLQGVIAGDMYLPTAGARQKSELFKDITFDKDVNDRFKPAVYQRSWNKATAKVYDLKDKGENAARDVAVATTWSHVYNDVLESYSAGNGFSIKTDISRLDEAEKPGKVLFRLPKADDFYEYYNEAGNDWGDRTDEVKAKHDNNHKLNDTEQTVTVEAGSNSQYFLAGNPFMTDIDMVAFLKANENVIASKYWLLDGENQTAAVMTGDKLVTVDGTGKVILPPMQGFFVEAKDAGTSLTLTYNEDMMYKPVKSGSTEGTRASATSEESQGMVITAQTADGYTSHALLRIDGAASHGYQANEDVMLLTNPEIDMPTMVYTVADDKAVAINTLPDPENTEVGVVTDGEHDVTLQFNHTEDMSGYMLYDSEQDTYTPITEGMTYQVGAGSRSRLVITAGRLMDAVDGIRISIAGNAIMVSTTRGQLDVKVYDTLGRSITHVNDSRSEVRIPMTKGIYIVEASDGEETITRKVVL